MVELGAASVRLLVRTPDRAAEAAAAIAAHPSRTPGGGRLARGRRRSPATSSSRRCPAAAQDAGLVARCADVPVVFEVALRPLADPAGRRRAATGCSWAGSTCWCTRRSSSSSCSPGSPARSTRCARPARRPWPPAGRRGERRARPPSAVGAVAVRPRPGCSCPRWSPGCRSRRAADPERAGHDRRTPRSPPDPAWPGASALLAGLAGAVVGVGDRAGTGRCSTCCRWCRSGSRSASSTGTPACCRPWSSGRPSPW